MFVGSRTIYFWGGIIGVDEANKQALRAALGGYDQAFPLRFTADPGLATGVVAGEISGFQSSEDVPSLAVRRTGGTNSSLVETFRRWFGGR